MSELNSGCDRFDELRERAFGDTGDAGAERLLRDHARRCAPCAARLRLEEHLAAGRREGLARKAPEALVDGMWERVEREIGPAGRERAPRRGGRLRERLVEIQAAAIVLLAIGVGALFFQTRDLRERERALTARLEARESLLLSGGAAAPASPLRAALAADRIDGATPASLRRTIAALPAGRTLLGPAETERALARLPLRFGAARALREGLRIDDGLQAFEALRILDALPYDPNEPIRTGRLFPRPGKVPRPEAM